jgi:putative Mg2+ transporter-C (MgtC) family protein
MTDFAEVILRLGAATLIGAAIGLNRDLRGKPIGVRTLGLVGLASAIAVLAVAPNVGGAVSSVDATSRVIQGVLTGIGFLGAGVIVRRNIDNRVHGLTSAASAWTTACLGLVCGLAAWPIVATGVVLVFMLLIFGGPFERMCQRWLGGHSRNAAEREAVDEAETPLERIDRQS